MAQTGEEMRQLLEQYARGIGRGTLFRDAVLADIRRQGPRAVVLDIGCGSGFHDDAALQQSLANESGRFIGVEPDVAVPLPPCFHEAHRCVLEDAPIEPGSVNVAYCTFVLEHIPQPERFWRKVHEVLRPGGVFWGFTVDSRHYFALLSRLLGRLKLAERYLTSLHGQRGEQRYKTYPTWYRANCPGQITPFTGAFARADFASLHRVGQVDFYFPRWLWPAMHAVDRLTMGLGLPGSVLAIRLQK